MICDLKRSYLQRSDFTSSRTGSRTSLLPKAARFAKSSSIPSPKAPPDLMRYDIVRR